MNHRYAQVFSFDGNVLFITVVLRSDSDILVDGIDSAVHEDSSFVQVKIDLFV